MLPAAYAQLSVRRVRQRGVLRQHRAHAAIGLFRRRSRQEAAVASVVARHRGTVLPVLAADPDACRRALRQSLLAVACGIGLVVICAQRGADRLRTRLRPSICRSPAPGNCWQAQHSPAAGVRLGQTAIGEQLARRPSASCWSRSPPSSSIPAARFRAGGPSCRLLGGALLLSAPQAWGCRHVLASPAMVWIGLISYPLYLWHWPLLVFFALIKFAPLTLLERGLIVGLSIALAWATYRFVEIPFRFGRPSPARLLSLGGGMALIAVAGAVVVENRGFDFRLPDEIRGMTEVATQSSKWRVHQCLIDLSRETSFADDCVDRGRRPLILLWGDLDRGRPDARLAQGPGKPRLRHRAVYLELLHPGAQHRCGGHAELPRHQRQGVVARPRTQARYRAAAFDLGPLSRRRGRYRGGAEAADQCPRRRAGFGAVVETRAAERGAALFHAASSSDSAAVRPRRSRRVGCEIARQARAVPAPNSFRCGTPCATPTAA